MWQTSARAHRKVRIKVCPDGWKNPALYWCTECSLLRVTFVYNSLRCGVFLAFSCLSSFNHFCSVYFPTLYYFSLEKTKNKIKILQNSAPLQKLRKSCEKCREKGRRKKENHKNNKTPVAIIIVVVVVAFVIVVGWWVAISVPLSYARSTKPAKRKKAVRCVWHTLVSAAAPATNGFAFLGVAWPSLDS